MSSDDLYFQCKLEREGTKQVAWIPKRGAIMGVYVQLLADDTLWKVTDVYEVPLTENYIREKQRMEIASLLSIK